MAKQPVNRPGERPLDDGVRYGPEPWREINGILFSHWDRWLLRLALTEAKGLDSIEAGFRVRAKSGRFVGDAPEAMLAQIADLKARLAGVGRGSEAVLDEEERASEWLQKKAFRRVWHDGPNRRTAAMFRTPRRVLAARALRGQWGRFQVSPALYEPELRMIVGEGGYYDHRWTGILAMQLEAKIELLTMVARSNWERLAIHRAAMTVIVETMDRVDDSLTEVSDVFAESESAYYPLARSVLDHDGVLRDLFEFAVWEDYGLFRDIEDFLRSLDGAQASVGVCEMAAIITELEREGLDYALAKACRLRRALVESADGHGSEDP